MRAILRTGFGGPEVLEIRKMSEPEPKAGHAVIEVRRSGSTTPRCTCGKESGPRSRTSAGSSVGLIKSCLGGEFAIGTKVAALMGGSAGRSTAVTPSHSRPRVERRGHRIGPVVGRPRSHPGDVRHGLDLLISQPGDCRRADAGDPRGDIVLRTGRSQHGGEHGRAGNRHHPKPGAIRLLEGLGVEQVEVEGPELCKRIAETKRLDAVLDLVGNSTILDSLAMLRHSRQACLARWLDSLAPVAGFNPLLQMARQRLP